MNYVKSLLCTLVVCTSFFFNAVQAQYQVDRNYAAKTIYLKGNRFVKDGIEYPNGFLFQNLKKEMEVSPHAVIEFKKYEKKRNIGIILSAAGLIGTLYAVPQVVSGNEKFGRNLMLGSLSASLISIPFTLKSVNHFHKSIWIRNGDALNN